MKPIDYKIMSKDGVELAGCMGHGALALAHALGYYQVYSEDEDVKLMADKKILIDYKG